VQQKALEAHRIESNSQISILKSGLAGLNLAHLKKCTQNTKDLSSLQKKAITLQTELKSLNSEVASTNAIQINNALTKAFDKYNLQVNKRFNNVISQITSAKEPIDKKLVDLRAAEDGLSR
jgi:hypothetical protein